MWPSITAFGQRGADFTPTQTGKVIVTTVPDSNANYGEVTIYVIDMQVDANHDGVIDNRDLTSAPTIRFVFLGSTAMWTAGIRLITEPTKSRTTWKQMARCSIAITKMGIGQYAIPCTATWKTMLVSGYPA